MRKIVILGTGTDVGKTYSTCRLASIIGQLTDTHSVLALKPIETGVSRLVDTDAARLGKCSRPRLSPTHAYAFEPGVSPHLAARMSGVAIDLGNIVSWIDEYCRRIGSTCEPSDSGRRRWVLIETAGGVFSPISESCTNLDLAVALEPACWLLIAPDRLGVLHDIHATLIAMASISRIPDMIWLNATGSPDASVGTNRRELGLLGWATVTGQIAWNGDIDAQDRAMLLSQLDRVAPNIDDE